MVKEFHVMNVSRGVLFTREKGGRKIESIFPNVDSALAVALEEAQNLPDVVVYVNGDAVYLSEIVAQDVTQANEAQSNGPILTNEEEDSHSGALDKFLSLIAAAKNSGDFDVDGFDPKDTARDSMEAFARNLELKDKEVDSHDDEVVSDIDIPDSFKKLENLEVGPIVHEDCLVVFGYTRDDNNKIEFFIQSLKQTEMAEGIGPVKVKIVIDIDGKKRVRNVTRDKVTSVVAKTYENISISCFFENDDAKTKEVPLINITRN